MELIDDLFEILGTTESDARFVTTIKLNPTHIVYAGHFPGNPVTPAVIQLQIVHELLERHLGKPLKLRNIAQCKFIRVLNPIITSQIDVYIELARKEEFVIVKASGENGPNIYFKLNSVYEF